jgi:hypothetical protein
MDKISHLCNERIQELADEEGGLALFAFHAPPNEAEGIRQIVRQDHPEVLYQPAIIRGNRTRTTHSPFLCLRVCLSPPHPLSPSSLFSSIRENVLITGERTRNTKAEEVGANILRRTLRGAGCGLSAELQVCARQARQCVTSSEHGAYRTVSMRERMRVCVCVCVPPCRYVCVCVSLCIYF